MKLASACVFFAATLLSAAISPWEEMPHVTGESLSGRTIDFPNACAGNACIIVIGFSHGSQVQMKPVIAMDTLEIDTRSKTVRRAGEFIRVTAKEYALLECLARDPDTLLDRETISERVWNEPYDPFSNLIEEYIKRLRKKIDVQGEKALIQGRRGEGYILTAKEFA